MGVDAEGQLRLRIDDPHPVQPAPVPRRQSRRAGHDTVAPDSRGATRPGRRPDAFYQLAVGAAVLHLGDRASLDCNALTQLSAVRKLADERYPGQIWRRGLCLRDLVKEAIQKTLDDAKGDDMERVRFVLSRAAAGNTLSSIASELGIRRESLSRGLWSRITGLIWERLKPRLLTLES